MKMFGMIAAGTLLFLSLAVSQAAPVAVSVDRLPGANPAPGLLELGGSRGLLGPARLAGPRADLPAITSETMGREDQVLVIQGLERAGSRSTALVVMNLGQTGASCAVSLIRVDGSDAIEPMTVALLPYARFTFTDIFKHLSGVTGEVRAEVTCSSDFYAYAQTVDRETGETTVTGPSQPVDTLEAAFDKAFKAAALCSSGRTVCNREGLVHTSTRKTPTLALSMSPPAGTYRSMKAHVEVVVNGWNEINPRGAHGVMYLAINKNYNLLGSIFLRGPSSNRVTLRHGFCRTAACKTKVEEPLNTEEGTRYVFDYEYNPGRGTTNLRVMHKGQLVAQIQDKPNVKHFTIKKRDEVVIGLSNPSVNLRPEPASINWRYSNLRVEFFQ